MESIVSAVIRATDNCNLDCKYCYERDKAKINMSIDTLKNVIKKFIDYNEYHAHFSWIGGEPLLRHNSFFEKIIELQEKNNTKNIIIKNSIQTNGLLLSPERLNFLRNLGYKVGISYDGTDDLTDALRISKNGKRYGKDISDCIHSCPRDVGTITVLTKKSIGRAKEIYDNLKAKEFFDETNEMLNSFYKHHYKFDLNDSYKQASKKNKLIYNKGYKLLEKCSKKETIVIHHLLNIVRRTWDMEGPLISLRLK